MKKLIILIFTFIFINPIFSQNDTIKINNSMVVSGLELLYNSSVILAKRKITNSGTIVNNKLIADYVSSEHFDPSAALEIISNSRGLLIPRLTTSERLLIQNPTESLLVYDTTKNNILYFSGDYDSDTTITEYNSELENLITKNIGDTAFWIEYPIWNGFLSSQKTEIINISENDTITIKNSYKAPTIWVQEITGSDTTYSLLDNVTCLEDSFFVKEVPINTDSLGFSYKDGYIWFSKDTSISEVVVAENDTVIDIDLHEIYWTGSSSTLIKTANFQCVNSDVNYEIIMNNLAQRHFYLIWKDPNKTILIEKF